MRALGLLLLFPILPAGCTTPPAATVRLPLASSAEASAWQFTDANAFRWATEDGRGCLELFGVSKYEPPHRSPLAMAILREPEFGDFTFRVQCKQTGREYPHRDLVVVFAYRDATHFAYAHLASLGDANAHQVMLVDGADRRPVTTQRTAGVAWGEGWHDIEVLRVGTRVEVLFDGAGPVLQATVPDWRGRVGVGSFDDTGRFRGLQVDPR